MEKFGKALIFTLSILGAFLLLAGAGKITDGCCAKVLSRALELFVAAGFCQFIPPEQSDPDPGSDDRPGNNFYRDTLFFIQELLLDRVNILASTDGNMVLYDVQPLQIAGVRRLASEMKVQLVDDVPVVALRYASIKGIPQGNECRAQKRL